MNSINDPLFKSEALHNIAVILYYEIKTHNKFIDDVATRKQQIEQAKKAPQRTPEERYDYFNIA